MSRIGSLPLPSGGKLTHLLHVSDLHIRCGGLIESRYQEYMTVFTRFCDSVAEFPHIDTCAVVITGDLFHNKSRLESTGIRLFAFLIHRLRELCPVYIIQGNHDYRQEEPDTPDMLSAFFTPETPSGVAYLDATGHYQAANVGFGVVSVRDILQEGDTSGTVENLPIFPHPEVFGDDVSTRVALLHHMVRNCELDNAVTGNGVPLEWMEGYDYGLFGDIHVQQVKETSFGLKWGYSGSLIQQHVGETLYPHGYLVWELATGNVTSVTVRNDVGFLKLCWKHSEWCVRRGNEYTALETLLDNPDCPPRLVFRASKHSKYLCHLRETMQEYPHITYEIHELPGLSNDEEESATNANTDEATAPTEQVSLADCNHVDTWCDYMTREGMSESLPCFREPVSVLLEESAFGPLETKARKRNQELRTLITTLESANEIRSPVADLRFIKIEFEYMLCFGTECSFDFTRLANQIGLISAMNGCGKSSFLEILCLSLFGRAIPSRSNKNESSVVICKHKPSNRKAFTTLQFALDGVEYKLHREYAESKTNAARLKIAKAELIAVATQSVLKRGSPAVDQWVKQNVGELEHFLLSGLITQNQDQDFLRMRPQEQMNLLDQCLRFDSVQIMTTLLKKSADAHKYMLDHLKTHVDSLRTTMNAASDTSEKDFAEMQVLLGALVDEMVALQPIRDDCVQWGLAEADLRMDPEDYPTYEFYDDCDPSERVEAIEAELAMLPADLVKEVDEDVDTDVETPKPVECPSVSKKQLDTWKREYQSWLATWDDEEYTADDVREFEEMTKAIPPVAARTREEYEAWCSSGKRPSRKKIVAKLAELGMNPEDQEAMEALKTTLETEMSRITLFRRDDYTPELHEKLESEEQRREMLRESKRALETSLAESEKAEPVAMPQEPFLGEDNVDIFLAEYDSKRDKVSIKRNRWKTHVAWQNRLATLEAEAQSAKTTHAHIESMLDQTASSLKNVPFNPDCEACRAQPLRVQLSQLQTQLEESQTQVDAREAALVGHRAEVPAGDYKKLESWLNLWDTYYEAKYTTMKATKAEWAVYREKRESYEEYMSALQAARELRTELSEASAELNTLESRAWEVAHVQAHLDSWLAGLAKLEVYEKASAWLDALSKLDFWEAVGKQLELRECWEYNMESLDIARRYVKEADGWRKTKELLDTVPGDWERYEAYLRSRIWVLKKERKELRRSLHNLYWSRVASHHEGWALYHSISEEISELRIRVAVVSREYASSLATRRALIALESQALALYDRMEYLQRTHRVFHRFRSWLYERRVLPQILARANSWLSVVCCDRVIELDAIVSESGEQIVWSFLDDGVRIPLEKSSGFQGWMMSLVLRLTLSTLGASRIRAHQLFIDEGFASLDSEHISRVPLFIQSILQMFDSIVLVSHLDMIRASVDIEVPIRRTGKFRRLVW